MSALEPDFDTLTTPLAWSDGAGLITGCNTAFSRWLGVSARRLQGWPLAGLDSGDGRLAEALRRAGDDTAPLRVRRGRLRYSDGEECFADLWLTRREGGGWLLEAHPVDHAEGLATGETDDARCLETADLTAHRFDAKTEVVGDVGARHRQLHVIVAPRSRAARCQHKQEGSDPLGRRFAAEEDQLLPRRGELMRSDGIEPPLPAGVGARFEVAAVIQPAGDDGQLPKRGIGSRRASRPGGERLLVGEPPLAALGVGTPPGGQHGRREHGQDEGAPDAHEGSSQARLGVVRG